MKILVVGASTFLGAPLTEALAAAGHDISILHPDARCADPAWRNRFHCHFGTCRDGHVLHDALEGVERVVACIASHAGNGELEQTRDLAQAAQLHGVTSLVKLSTAPPLRNASWHPMRVRRYADQLLDGLEIPSCIAEVGWIGESLRNMIVGNRIWLPHPLSCPGRMRWQSRGMAIARLTEIVQASELPRRATVWGDDHATLCEITGRLIAKHPRLERVYLPGRLFRWLEKLPLAPAFSGCRMVHGFKESDPPPLFGLAQEDALRDW